MSREHIPEDLRELEQWVCWRREQRAGRTPEVPYQALVVNQYGGGYAVRFEEVAP